jgi:hypothetical protein
MICGVYRLCSSGDEGAVKERLSRLPKSSIQQCTKAPSDEDVDVSKYYLLCIVDTSIIWTCTFTWYKPFYFQVHVDYSFYR